MLFKSEIAKVNEKWNGGHFLTQTIISTDYNKATGYWMLFVFLMLKRPQDRHCDGYRAGMIVNM